ncbi:MAG: nucleotidyltransferase domain-containing protein [candidate division WOR-3 bacterium]
MTIKKIIAKTKRILIETPEVVVGYLFGSVLEGYEHKKSDIDIAVLFDNSLNKFQIFDLEIKLGNRLQEVLQRSVDVVVLNRADPGLVFRAIRGTLIFEKDPTTRALFEAKAMGKYYFQKHYQRVIARILYEKAKDYGTIR